MEVKIRRDMIGKYWAELWLLEEYAADEGDTEEIARERLKEHLANIIPIYEDDIGVAQEKIKAIKEFLSKSPSQG